MYVSRFAPSAAEEENGRAGILPVKDDVNSDSSGELVVVALIVVDCAVGEAVAAVGWRSVDGCESAEDGGVDCCRERRWEKARDWIRDRN